MRPIKCSCRPAWQSLIALVFLALTASCATVFEGTSQSITMNVTPTTATCEAMRNGEKIGSVQGGSNQLTISKSRHDIILSCSAPGYAPQSITLTSSATTGGVASVLFFDLGITDYATGALNSYPKSAQVALSPLAGQGNGATAATYGNPVSGLMPTAAPAGARYRTRHNGVLLHGYYPQPTPVPRSVPLSLVSQSGSRGLFSFPLNTGTFAQGWIELAEVETF